MHISALLNLLRVKNTLIKRHRKAITPVLATIILIAITLIAGVAIAGFVFGLFGTSANSPAVGFVTSDVDHAVAGKGATTWDVDCIPKTNSWLQFKNSGGGPTSMVSLKLSYNGKTISANIITAGGCTISAQGTVYATFDDFGTAAQFNANAGDTFSGTATLSNGATVPFSGTFT